MRQTIAQRHYRRKLGPPKQPTRAEWLETQVAGELARRRMERFDRLPKLHRRIMDEHGEALTADDHRFLWERQKQLGIRVIDEPPPPSERDIWNAFLEL